MRNGRKATRTPSFWCHFSFVMICQTHSTSWLCSLSYRVIENGVPSMC